jgi:acetylglutamate kinase
LAPLTHDGAGQILNTNADTIAGEVAAALAEEFEVELLYVFEYPGVMQNPDDLTSVIPHINREKFDQLVKDGVVAGGMLPKLENCLKAVERGVHQVRITRLEESTATEGFDINSDAAETPQRVGRFAPGTLITLS